MSLTVSPVPFRRAILVTGCALYLGILGAGGAVGQTAAAPPSHDIQDGITPLNASPVQVDPVTPATRGITPNGPAPSAATAAQSSHEVQDGITPLNPRVPEIAAPAAPSPSTFVSAPAAAPASSPPAAPPTANLAFAPATLPVPAAVSPPATIVLAPPPAPEPIVLDHPKVIDTATLQNGTSLVTLFGIEGVAGESARGMQSYLAAGDGHMTCGAHGSAGFVCLMSDGTDVAMVALINGAAQTKPEATDAYRDQEAQAQNARRGIWINLPPPPEAVKAPVVRDTATLATAEKTYLLDGVVGFAMPYSNQLQGYINANGNGATCSPQGDPGRFVCLMADGTDVAKVALVNGAARVDDNAPDSYRTQQMDALNNRRGYWASASASVIAAAMMPMQQNPYILIPGDDGSDGITYVGDAPVTQIDGEQVFLIYGDDNLGWGYYDRGRHWHGAPDRFRQHMERFHPGGNGLRGYGGVHYDHLREHQEGMRREISLHRNDGLMRNEGMMRRDEGFRGPAGRGGMGGMERPGMGRAGMERGGFERSSMGRPGMEQAGMGRPGMERVAMGRPGPGMEHVAMGRPAMQGAPPSMGRPGMPSGRPQMGGMGGMRPPPMAQARPMPQAPRPMAVAARPPPAPRAAAPSGGGKHR